MKLKKKASKKVGRKLGGKNTKKSNKRKTQVELTPEQINKLNKQLNNCMTSAFLFVEEVFKSNEKITIEGYTKEGIKTKKIVDKYSSELKVRIFEKLADKVFADRREIKNAPIGEDDDGRLKVVNFTFTEKKK